jgi:hypothetical protein
MMAEEQIIDALDEAQEIIPFTYSITSYGADYPIDSLVKRINNNDILVPTFEHEEQLADDVDAFQREYVWPRPKADRFIESLLLGLPVPGIFLVKEDTGRLLVLDSNRVDNSRNPIPREDCSPIRWKGTEMGMDRRSKQVPSGNPFGRRGDRS